MGRSGADRAWGGATARTSFAWAVLAALALAASPQAARAALSDRLCLASGAGRLEAYPTAGDLQRAAADTERGLARRGGGEPVADTLAPLDLTASQAERPSPGAIAEYCLAAGELMRVSPQGSQLQAQSYLLGAFQTASAAGLAEPASMAAYRLGLLSLSGSGGGGTRGAKGPRVVRGATAVRDAAVLGDRPCDVLRSAGVMTSAGLRLSMASLACSADQARRAGDDRTAALAELRLAHLRLGVAEANSEVAPTYRAQAGQAAAEGLADAGRIADPALRAELLGRLAMASLDAEARPDPQLAAVATTIRAAGGPAALALADALEARLAFAVGEATGARRLMEQALLHESQRDLPARLPQWRLMLAGMDPANREAHVLAAYDALEAIRPLLPRFDPLTEESAFSLYMRQVFQSAVDVQLAGAEGSAAPIRVRSAQQIVEAYRQAELQSVFGSECLPARDALKPETLAAGEVLLYPVLLPDRLELLYVAGGAGAEATFHRLPPNRSVDRQAVSRLVETMVVSLSEDVEGDERWRAASRQLYDLLIKPIEGELKPGAELAIVPDGPLRAVPFSALLDADNRFLVQKTRVSVAPSLAYSQPGGETEHRGQQLVAASLEMEVRLPAGEFEKLTGTGDEAKVAAVVDGKRIERAWVIENFKKADLVQALTREQVDVLHLATHASFNGRSDRAFIVANGELILLSELRQILSANRTRGEELDLLVLSACETAVGDDEASMGLAGAAVQAGAKSAIASLWPVNDVGTAELMKDFYQLYRDGRSKSAALREAQLMLIGKGGAYADPNVWAAFTLLGAWR
ncbi:MAG: CHAT domain-containing protein [Caulobacterales bacterium]|nr:CHAT domain-containing protein [Caulobacterales bacterium]